jgi:hypothetical protein
MKLGVLATGPTMEHLVAASHRQGVYLIEVDTDTMRCQAKTNDPKMLEFPLGRMLFAKMLSQDGVQALLSGYCNDSLCHLLDAEGIAVATGNFGFVSRAVRNYIASLPAVTAPRPAMV